MNLIDRIKRNTVILKFLLVTIVILDIGVKTANADSVNCISDKDKIEILLKEYDTLRAEMLQRFDNRFQFIVIIGAIGAYAFLKGKKLPWNQVLIVIFASVSVIVIWFWIGYIAATQSRRISEIEKQVNKLAGQELMQWESYQIDNGIFHKIYKWPAPKDCASE